MDGKLNKNNEDNVSEDFVCCTSGITNACIVQVPESPSNHQTVEGEDKGSNKPLRVDRNAMFTRVKNAFAKRIRSKEYIDMKVRF